MTESEVLKQIPRMVINIHKVEDEQEVAVYGIDAMFGRCPTCDEYVSSLWNDCYCGGCGQKLDWSDENEID